MQANGSSPDVPGMHIERLGLSAPLLRAPRQQSQVLKILSSRTSSLISQMPTEAATMCE